MIDDTATTPVISDEECFRLLLYRGYKQAKIIQGLRALEAMDCGPGKASFEQYLAHIQALDRGDDPE